jgi:ferredoxin-type protein NapF
VFLIAAVLLLLPQTRAWGLAYVVPALSPLVALASMISTRSFDWMSLLGFGVAVIVLMRRRWFCRWACPTGLLADMATGVGRRGGRSCPRLPPIGQWLALITLGGALLGYPMLLWLDPLALLSSSFGILAKVSGTVVWLSVGGILALLLLSVIWPGIWCHRICPLGATQDLLAHISRITVSRITQQAVQQDDRPTSGVANPGMSRRFVLGTIVGIGWAFVARVVLGNKPHCLRPPGALEETRFVGLCLRCGNCTRACPTNIIKPDILQHGVAGLLAPVVEFDGDYCREDCTRCTNVCPSGALGRVAVEDKIAARIGLARVDMDVCLLAEDRECSACRNNCPFEAITYVWSDIDYTLTPNIDPSKCPGCGACEVACPTRPTRAIVVFPS